MKDLIIKEAFVVYDRHKGKVFKYGIGYRDSLIYKWEEEKGEWQLDKKVTEDSL